MTAEVNAHTELAVTDPSSDAAPKETPRVHSMHEDVAVWEGCGSCGAEPYWLEIGSETAMSPGTNDDDRQDDA